MVVHVPIDAFSILRAWIGVAIIDALLTGLSSVASLALTTVAAEARHFIQTIATILARIRVAIIDVDLTYRPLVARIAIAGETTDLIDACPV